MSTLIILLLCGAAGGFIFEWFGLPGGAMTGAIIAVILLKSFSSLPQAAFPRPFHPVFMLALACWSATCTGRKCCWRSGTRGPYW
ncbi:MAG: hypothetical protein ACLUDQ_08915 [Bilophila wadsworthia]